MRTVSRVTELFGSYARPELAYDEMMSPDGVRPAYEAVLGQMEALSADEMRTRSEYVQSSYVDQGVTFDIGGEERPFPIDIVPRVIAANEWAHVEAGVRQRVTALERFLGDVYGPGDVFKDRVIPKHVVLSSPHFHRVMARAVPPNGVRVHVSGIDLIRDNEGTFRVLEDNVRIPSGVSYVITNRQAMHSALPEVTMEHRIRPVQHYAQKLLAALRACAPSGIADPTVVVLTPGVYNSAYFEHALLARLMGCELVEGRDLVCMSGQVLMRTTQGLRPVHVIYRRVDDDFLDPVHFRKDSLLGTAGLVNAARAGNVTLANAVGNGVADDKLVYTYVPDLIRYYLGEEPILASVDTWRCEEAAAREEVLDRLDELVLKPVDGSGGKGIVIGPRASREELDAMRARLIEDPRGWIAQPVVQLSTVPTMINGAMAPRHVDLRPFAVNDGNDVFVLPGGLTRVALPEGELIVNSSQGGGSKDTWVLAPDTGEPVDDVTPSPARYRVPPRSQRQSQSQSQSGGGSQSQSQSQSQSGGGAAAGQQQAQQQQQQQAQHQQQARHQPSGRDDRHTSAPAQEGTVASC